MFDVGPAGYRYPDNGDVLTAATIENGALTSAEWDQQEEVILAHFADELTTLAPRHRLLDYGSGEGRITERYAGLFDQITSFEADPARARRQADLLAGSPHLDKITIVLSVAEATEGAHEYDAALCSHVLQHVQPQVANAILAHLQGALRPGGLLLLTSSVHTWDQELYTVSSFDANGKNVERPITPADFDAVYEHNESGLLPIHFFSFTDLVERIRAAGLEVLAGYAFHGPAGVVGPLPEPTTPAPRAAPVEGAPRGEPLAGGRDIAVIARNPAFPAPPLGV